eukprot:gnl/MRDRNA2_/MRDRNA2_65493_c0_seq2.p1 gnl/MRDRNA2_/MRDRNA2_65493_c0~~gnl/MRDRNA2_/MRDRNA2_65493_c0_seq2.p1  ORF type:complete len:153 (+),score=6.54 gnl/MRDRNA2_/MRDRNA2_65493_c0_seq2:197-655(+)
MRVITRICSKVIDCTIGSFDFIRNIETKFREFLHTICVDCRSVLCVGCTPAPNSRILKRNICQHFFHMILAIDTFIQIDVINFSDGWFIIESISRHFLLCGLSNGVWVYFAFEIFLTVHFGNFCMFEISTSTGVGFPFNLSAVLCMKRYTKT